MYALNLVPKMAPTWPQEKSESSRAFKLKTESENKNIVKHRDKVYEIETSARRQSNNYWSGRLVVIQLHEAKWFFVTRAKYPIGFLNQLFL
jgi:hypothetical protein